MKHSFLLFLCSACYFFCNAQSSAPLEKTLLWRISGKGLTMPSYLYGTMHLPDERLFNFSDSLLLAIEKSQGFAMEVDPDEMMTVVMEQLFNNENKSRLLRDVVSRKAYAKYSPMLAKRLKKQPADISVKDVVREQNKWMQEAYTKGSMPTFVDAWLFDIARKQGKWVGGIEDIQDQTGLMEEVFNEQDLEFLTVDYSGMGRKYLNTMVDIYAKQDIQEIEAFTNDGGSRRKDVLLLRRNVKMARRMDSLSAIRTMVYAIGAAHLPGDSGVISLLRQHGFIVDPVFSAKKIAGKDYLVAEKPAVWSQVEDSKGLYRIEMPGKASTFKVGGMVEMHMNINLFTSSGYFVMAVPTSQNMQNPDSNLLMLARNMMQDQQLKQGVSIFRNGMKGREYVSKSPGEYKRGQLFSSGQTVYVAFAFFTKEENLGGVDASRFFNSLQLHEPEKSTGSRFSFAGLLPGLQGEAPVVLEPNKEMDERLKEKDFDTRVFMGIDAQQGGVYMLISKTTINDRYLHNDSLFLDNIRNNNRSKVKKMEIDTLRFDGNFYSLEQKGIYKEQQVLYHGKNYIKGNRCYSLLAVVPPNKENEEAARQVIQSFKVQEPAASLWASQGYNKQFSTWAPGGFSIPAADSTDDDTNRVFTLNVRDTNTSYSYTVMYAAFDSTVWYNSRAAYWESKLKDFESDEDTIISKLPFAANGLEGYDVETRSKNWQGKTKRYRLFTQGDTLYTLFSCLPAADVNNANNRRFFTDFRFNKPVLPATVFTSKAAQFIARFSGTDSAAREAAYNNFYAANFTQADIPLLRQTMIQHYGWDTGYNFYSSVQTKLGDKLLNLGDSTLSGFIRKEYKQRNGRDDEEQTCLLRFIASEPNKENMQFIINGLRAINDSSVINNSVFYYLDDSLLLLKQFVPDMITLTSKKNMVEPVTDLVKTMLDSSLLQAKDLVPYETPILQFGKKQLQEINKEKEGYGFSLSSVSVVAGRLKTPSSLHLLKQMSESRHNAVKMEAVHGLLEAGQPIAENILQTIAADRSLRTELLQTLGRKHQEIVFPKLYKSQQWLGESNLYDHIADDDDVPAKMLFVTMRKATINGKPANVYVYKATFINEEETNVHLGAIAFPANLTILQPLPYASAVLWDDEYVIKNQEKQIKQLLISLKKNAEEE